MFNESFRNSGEGDRDLKSYSLFSGWDFVVTIHHDHFNLTHFYSNSYGGKKSVIFHDVDTILSSYTEHFFIFVNINKELLFSYFILFIFIQLCVCAYVLSTFAVW